MKFISYLFGVTVLFLACSAEKPNALTLESQNVREVFCPKGDAQPPCATVDLTFPVFAGGALADSLNRFVLDCLCFSLMEDKSCPDVQTIAGDFIGEYKALLADLPDETTGWELAQKIAVTRDTLGVLSMKHETYVYTGGAHGLPSTLFYNLSRENGRLLALEDLLQPNARTSLLIIAEQVFRAEQEIPAGQSLQAGGFWFENDVFALPENFTITNEGLLFLYNPYEIASYADGMIEVLVPFERIQALLK